MKIITENIYATIPVLVMCFFSLLLIGFIIIRRIRQKSCPQILFDTILILGLLSFSYPLSRLIIGLFQTADAVNHGGEVSSTLIWAGIRYSLIPITMGFVSLHISAIGWFVVKRFKGEKKKPQ